MGALRGRTKTEAPSETPIVQLRIAGQLNAFSRSPDTHRASVEVANAAAVGGGDDGDDCRPAVAPMTKQASKLVTQMRRRRRTRHREKVGMSCMANSRLGNMLCSFTL
ncbi:Hypothetical Protein FCC1311_073742 [Hondaea fermentalgiana]|uniref:Uncharacterized protein n=1 Tax=Hondaea fermentalgiana TaxID=2315210 RepID=A0A2R5GR93_9STRA|nr:Hypothetical Protein FCC1311_073742 [Hondaea fermentalgiana]|eukprot:GBG31153.1 Hypothetical Protein FCC1311_073742 [Hondaea fermentalgiana]